MREPVGQHREPRRPHAEHRSRDLAADGGKVDGFTCAVGTGGTLAGVERVLEAKNPSIVTAAADPIGAAIYSWIKTGELKGSGSSISEGIGQGRVTGNLARRKVDDAFQIPDSEMVPICFDLVQTRRPAARRLDAASTSRARSGSRASSGPGKTIVTILCDSGSRYQSKLYNPAFLRSKGLPTPPWLDR